MRQKLKTFFSAFITRYFLKHLVYALITVAIIISGCKFYLNSYTHNSESYLVDVPNLIGLKSTQLKETLEPLGLELDLEHMDTVFSDKGARGTVLLQNPGPTKITKEPVKKGRKVAVTIISNQPKLIKVPNLVNKSRRHAEGVLKIIGLKTNVKYRPYNDCNDCVIEQMYRGKPLKEGAKVAKGETVTLILGQKSGEQVTVVDLNGLTIEEAEKRLSNSSLTMFIVCENCKTKKDSSTAIAYRQAPAHGVDVAVGTEISVWFTNDKSLTPE
ncbi:MAG TPA: PASTA domain-containing protein [Flavobacteriales bacterium]|nr:PASTA domain-containing protein [Flavobacteriales bacterium]